MKTITNKKYEEFWEKDEFDVKKIQDIQDKTGKDIETIKKELRKEMKKEIQKETGELSEKIDTLLNKGVITTAESTEDKKVKRPKKKPVVKKEEVETVVKNELTEFDPNKKLTARETYERYVIEKKNFRIFFRGVLIFDSSFHKDYPVFKDDHFILFGKIYIYKGIRIDTY